MSFVLPILIALGTGISSKFQSIEAIGFALLEAVLDVEIDLLVVVRVIAPRGNDDGLGSLPLDLFDETLKDLGAKALGSSSLVDEHSGDPPDAVL
jgi:hypothetical protein